LGQRQAQFRKKRRRQPPGLAINAGGSVALIAPDEHLDGIGLGVDNPVFLDAEPGVDLPLDLEIAIPGSRG